MASRQAELRRLAAETRMSIVGGARRRQRRRRRVDPLGIEVPVTIRYAFPDDDYALSRLAALDSCEVPRSPVLLGEVGGELQAALSLADGAVVADPFRRTAALVELLAARAEQLKGTAARPHRRRLVRGPQHTPFRLDGQSRL